MLSHRIVARGEGWSVADVVCTSGPRDRPFEEKHAVFSIAIVRSGTFQYRAQNGCELMTPGSLLLGNSGQCFECGHEHGTGDRCLSFSYQPEIFEPLSHAAGARSSSAVLPVLRLPPLAALSPLIARACAGLVDQHAGCWEELTLELAAQVISLARGISPSDGFEPSAAARVTRAVRLLDHAPATGFTLADLAREARLSPFHFLRTFRALTCLTPHQYVRRLRLQKAAAQLTASRDKVLDVALASGFEDISTFHRAFRTEFGLTPQQFRLQNSRPPVTASPAHRSR